MKTLTAALLMASLSATSAGAIDQQHGFEIRRALSGITLDGIYPDGGFFSETYNADGTLSYHDASRNDSGTWETVRDQFCTYYKAQKGGCFYVTRSGDNCFIFYSAGDKTPRQIQPGSWNARGWNHDRPATCPKGPEVET